MFELLWEEDRRVVLATVRVSGISLRSADVRFQADREIVLAAVSQNGIALQYASADLRRDRHIVHTAVTDAGIALEYAAEELQAEGGGGCPYMDLTLPSYAGYLRQLGPRAGHDLL
eukprot:1394274-Amphidinium_carterae.1